MHNFLWRRVCFCCVAKVFAFSCSLVTSIFNTNSSITYNQRLIVLNPNCSNMSHSAPVSSQNKMKMIIIHPDLGIVDIAKAMQVLGHDIKLYTSHHDTTRCFEETRGDGVIAKCIEVHGGWLPRQIFGRCTALCAIVRMIYVSLVAIYGHYVGKSKPSLIFIDSVSVSSDLSI